MRRSLAPFSTAVGLGLALLAPCALATPDEMGPLPVVSWDAGTVTLSGARIHVVVYHPRGAAMRPLVGVVHGASRTGAYQRVLAETLASYGLVAVVPDMPCTVFGCDHDANAMQLLAMLDWAVAQSAMAASPVAGTIDGARRGLIGHSWGALASELAAARSPSLASLVLLDPNDDARVGAMRAPGVHVPTLQLLAQGRGTCNNQWIAASISPTLGGPWLQVTVPRSGHCDPEEPSDALCPVFCGGGSDRSTTPYFRRYAVAWTLCNLTADAAMAPWVGGTSFDADVSAGRLSGMARSGIDLLTCRSADAGRADAAFADVDPIDAFAPDAITDAITPDATADALPLDAMTDAPPPDATMDGPTPDTTPLNARAADARSPGTGAAVGDGCQCNAVGARSGRGFASIALGLAAAWAMCRTRRRA